MLRRDVGFCKITEDCDSVSCADEDQRPVPVHPLHFQGRLLRSPCADPEHVSHWAIYASLFLQPFAEPLAGTLN